MAQAARATIGRLHGERAHTGTHAKAFEMCALGARPGDAELATLFPLPA
jgi:hypothetical protein